jgi:hypothetical protein
LPRFDSQALPRIDFGVGLVEENKIRLVPLRKFLAKIVGSQKLSTSDVSGISCSTNE